MGILSAIFDKIFPSSLAAPAPSAPAVASSPAPKTSAAPAPAPAAVPATATPSGMPMVAVDVEAVLVGMANQNSQKLNWRSSIVDLLKLLGLDSSLQSRKELATELHFTGDTSDSAGMNTWLHRQVMNKLAANGGKVPAEWRD